jgi:hypothetical protein
LADRNVPFSGCTSLGSRDVVTSGRWDGAGFARRRWSATHGSPSGADSSTCHEEVRCRPHPPDRRASCNGRRLDLPQGEPSPDRHGEQRHRPIGDCRAGAVGGSRNGTPPARQRIAGECPARLESRSACGTPLGRSAYGTRVPRAPAGVPLTGQSLLLRGDDSHSVAGSERAAEVPTRWPTPSTVVATQWEPRNRGTIRQAEATS